MRRFLAILVFIGLSFIAFAQTVEVQHLSELRTLVRTDGGSGVFLLPVQESSPDASIKVLADTDLWQTINVRLATDKVDYFVPLDLGQWKTKSVLLDITSARRDRRGDICWKEMKYSGSFELPAPEPFRPAYHFAPSFGWMNDPNGMVYKDGLWHLFFQYNPYGNIWGNMTWGHAVSRDLTHWEQWENAILPNELGSVFSGSAVVDENNTAGFGKGAIVAMYTSAGTTQTQSIAWSTDGGKTFNIYGKNPVIVADIRDFRDPKVFWDKGSNQWKVVLAAGQEVQFWASDNLRDWKYESSFGKGFGCHGGVWECPDFFELDGKWVLIVNINPGGPFGGSATQYFIGEYDGKQFICDDAPETTRWMDYGKDHYATVTWSGAPDGRRVAIAWMSNWQYANVIPTKGFRSANSVPRDLKLLSRPDGPVLVSSPSPEVEALRGKAKAARLSSKPVKLFPEPRGTYEIVLEFVPPKKGVVGFTLNNGQGEKVLMSYDPSAKTFSMDRKASGDVAFSNDFPAETVAPTLPGKRVSLRLLVDNSSIEVFGDDFCMTNLVFPSTPFNTITATGAKVQATIYPLNP